MIDLEVIDLILTIVDFERDPNVESTLGLRISQINIVDIFFNQSVLNYCLLLVSLPKPRLSRGIIIKAYFSSLFVIHKFCG